MGVHLFDLRENYKDTLTFKRIREELMSEPKPTRSRSSSIKSRLNAGSGFVLEIQTAYL